MKKPTISRTYTASTLGLTPVQIDVEVDTIQGTPNLIIIGLPGKAVDEAKERITSALIHCGIKPKAKRTIVNLAPADLRKSGSALELAICIGLLKQYKEVTSNTDNMMFFGELALDGKIKAVTGILPLVLAARKKGFSRVVVPQANIPELEFLKNITIHPISHLEDFLEYSKNGTSLPTLATKPFKVAQNKSFTTFNDVIGQETGKRALTIAAAGGHNVLLIGPPGSGKSMLAKTLTSILPPITEQEAIAVTAIHSVAGLTQQTGFITQRPFRNPHHTTSQVGLIGGSNQLKPGEISLAHHGILFLDEFPEFNRPTLEALRQPMEDGRITISRAIGSTEYPASFSLVAAANPCPCGFYGSSQKECNCSLLIRENYQKKFSGPILDRIDLRVHVDAIETKKLSLENKSTIDIKLLQQKVNKSREKQVLRLKPFNYYCNGDMPSQVLKKVSKMNLEAKEFLNQAISSLQISVRGYFSIWKVAQTIADLEGAEEIQKIHVAEALQYRS